MSLVEEFTGKETFVLLILLLVTCFMHVNSISNSQSQTLDLARITHHDDALAQFFANALCCKLFACLHHVNYITSS